jgi:cell division septation protein DedD
MTETAEPSREDIPSPNHTPQLKSAADLADFTHSFVTDLGALHPRDQQRALASALLLMGFSDTIVGAVLNADRRPSPKD